MKDTKYAYPIAQVSGSIDNRTENGRKHVTRRMPIGQDQNGKTVYKQQSYVYHLNEKGWSEAAQRNRLLFQAAQKQARTELKDAARKAYWEEQYAEHRNSYHQGDRLYLTLLGFVSAMLHAQLKQSGQFATPS